MSQTIIVVIAFIVGLALGYLGGHLSGIRAGLYYASQLLAFKISQHANTQEEDNDEQR